MPFKLASVLEASSAPNTHVDLDRILAGYQDLLTNSTRNYQYGFSLERSVIRNSNN